MSNSHCAVQGCKTSIFKKPVGVYLHSCPTSSDMRNKWLHALKNRCTLLDWSRSRICSKHFESKYFDSLRRLRKTATPTLFPIVNRTLKDERAPSKTKLDVLLGRLTQAELMADVRSSLKRVKDPLNIDNIVSDELKCRPDAPTEAHLWLLLKKQEHLNNRLLSNVVQNKKQVDMLQKNVPHTNLKKDSDQNLETYKYIVKCLQEKLATLEEQIEILTAVESR